MATTTQAFTPSPPSPENTAYLIRLGEGMQSVNMGGAMLTTINNDVVNEMDEMPLETLIRLLTEAQTDEEIVNAMYMMQQSYRNANTSPGFISRIVRDLPPEPQIDALRGYVSFMAQRDFARASAWLDALSIADSAHATLLSHALSVAFNYNRLSQSEALEIIDSWPDSPEREKARRWINRK